MTGREERRIMILEAAKDLFSVRGFYATRIDDIAREALIGKGTVYEYFDSKQSLLQEVLKYIISSYHHGMKQALNCGDNARDRLVSFALYHTVMMEKNSNLVQSMTADAGVLAQELKPLLAQYELDSLGLLKEVISAGMEKGELNPAQDGDQVVSVVLGAINQFSLRHVCYDKQNASKADVETIIDILLQGIR